MAEAADCTQKAFELLARRTHFRRQLDEKLRSRGFSEASVDETLDRLEASGYLDDERAARELVEVRLRRGPVGRRRMRYELEKRGAGDDVVERVLDETYAEGSDVEGAREAARLWLRRGRRDPAALARYLDRQGFGSGAVLTVVEELRQQERSTSES